jgi:hypothetical protein
MRKSSTSLQSDLRLGFHYFPDTYHYREADLQTWLPVLQELGVSWLVLRSDLDRAIPEHFLQGLKQACIEPLIQFPLPLERMPDLQGVSMLLDVYARWGGRYAIFYDRPNARAAWPAASWMQEGLVERFLDRYLPLANLTMQSGMAPVFPPLEPGGSYWDTAFLRSALQGMQRRKQDLLLQSLVLSAYGWRGGLGEPRSLDWGAGGPERWPQVRPYHLPADSQDQRGFRIFDWYLAIARSVLQESCPLILLQAGFPGDPDGLETETAWSVQSAQDYLHIARLSAGEKVMDALDERNQLEALPVEVIGCAFWLLGADAASPYASQAWFQEEALKHPALDSIRSWQRARKSTAQRQEAQKPTDPPQFPIRHYLLLPGYEWGVSDWYLEVIRPFVKKHRPTVGFSTEEAEKSERVTVVGNEHNFPEDLLARLERAGCQVEQIRGDGTNIATELAER